MSRRAAYRILILGGYGHFGARIAAALAGGKESQIVIARKLIAGELSATGARPCMDLMTLDDFDTAVKQLDIHWTVAQTSP